MSGHDDQSRQDEVRPRVLQALPGELDLREREERAGGGLSLMSNCWGHQEEPAGGSRDGQTGRSDQVRERGGSVNEVIFIVAIFP